MNKREIPKDTLDNAWIGDRRDLLRHGAVMVLLASGTGYLASVAATPTTIGQPARTARQDGYALLVKAGEALRACRRYTKFEREGGSLEEKRAVLAEPLVRKALGLLREAVARPMTAPAMKEDGQAHFEEFSKFRSLARLLALQQSVQYADGQGAAGLETAKLGMRLGRAVQADTMITGLVGLAINSLTLGTVGEHLDRLTASDHEKLLRLCRDWLRAPSLYPKVMRGEHRFALRQLSRTVPNAKAEEAPFRDLHDALLREWKKPAWRRAAIPAPDTSTVGGQLAFQVLPALSRGAESYTREEAMLRLLACHAAIRLHRHRTGAWPADLATLKLGDLITDPFSGKPFVYTAAGATYDLSSIGPVVPEGDPRAKSRRRSIRVTPASAR